MKIRKGLYQNAGSVAHLESSVYPLRLAAEVALQQTCFEDGPGLEPVSHTHLLVHHHNSFSVFLGLLHQLVRDGRSYHLETRRHHSAKAASAYQKHRYVVWHTEAVAMLIDGTVHELGLDPILSLS